jgi:hypothetical protein
VSAAASSWAAGLGGGSDTDSTPFACVYCHALSPSTVCCTFSHLSRITGPEEQRARVTAGRWQAIWPGVAPDTVFSAQRREDLPKWHNGRSHFGSVFLRLPGTALHAPYSLGDTGVLAGMGSEEAVQFRLAYVSSFCGTLVPSKGWSGLPVLDLGTCSSAYAASRVLRDWSQRCMFHVVQVHYAFCRASVALHCAALVLCPNVVTGEIQEYVVDAKPLREPSRGLQPRSSAPLYQLFASLEMVDPLQVWSLVNELPLQFDDRHRSMAVAMERCSLGTVGTWRRLQQRYLRDYVGDRHEGSLFMDPYAPMEDYSSAAGQFYNSAAPPPAGAPLYPRAVCTLDQLLQRYIYQISHCHWPYLLVGAGQPVSELRAAVLREFSFRGCTPAMESRAWALGRPLIPCPAAVQLEAYQHLVELLPQVLDLMQQEPTGPAQQQPAAWQLVKLVLDHAVVQLPLLEAELDAVLLAGQMEWARLGSA